MFRACCTALAPPFGAPLSPCHSCRPCCSRCDSIAGRAGPPRTRSTRDSCCATKRRQPAFTSCTIDRRSTRRSRESNRMSPRLVQGCRSPTLTATDGPTSTSPTVGSANRTHSITTAVMARSTRWPRQRGSPTSIAPEKVYRWAPCGATSTTTAERTCWSTGTAIWPCSGTSTVTTSRMSPHRPACTPGSTATAPSGSTTIATACWTSM